MVIVYNWNNCSQSRTNFLVFRNCPVVCSFVGTQFAVVRCQTSVLVLVIYGLLAVFKYLTTSFARVGPFLSVDMLLVFIQNNIWYKSFTTFITSLTNAHMNCLNVFLQSKFTFPNAANKLFATVLAYNFSFRAATEMMFILRQYSLSVSSEN